MEAELHDGTILEFPDGTNPQVIQATVRKMLGQESTRQPFDTTLTMPERAALTVDKYGSKVSDFIKRGISAPFGMAAPVVEATLPNRQNITDFAAGASGLMRGGANLIQPELGQNIWPTAAASPESGMRTLGSLADPVSLVIGGGVGKILPYAPVLGKGVIEGAKALGQNVLAGTVTGGAIGGLSEHGTVTEGAAMGAALSVALPAAIASGKYIGKTVRDVADLILPGGAQRISNRYVNVIIGDKNKDVLAKALSQTDDIVQGSKPTAAEAVSHLPSGSPIQAHQLEVAKEPGGISAQFGQRIKEQSAAIDKAFSWAGTEDDVQKLIKDRTAAVKPLYESIKTSTAKVQSLPVLAKVDKLLKENSNRDIITIPLNKIRDGLVPKQGSRTYLERNPQNLKSLSDQIGDMMGKKTSTGQPEFDVKVLREIKETIDDQISKVEPSFAKAQAVFMELSKPINKMQIGQTLKEKLSNPTGAETPGTYLRALNNEKKLLKESIGFGRKGVEDYLSPDELSSVNKVAADLERRIASKHPVQATNLRGGINIAGETTISLPNLLSRPAMIANYAIKSLGGNIEPEIDAYFAQLYLNPKELSKIIAKIPPAQRSQVAQAIGNYGRAMAVNAATQENK